MPVQSAESEDRSWRQTHLIRIFTPQAFCSLRSSLSETVGINPVYSSCVWGAVLQLRMRLGMSQAEALCCHVAWLTSCTSALCYSWTHFCAPFKLKKQNPALGRNSEVGYHNKMTVNLKCHMQVWWQVSKQMFVHDTCSGRQTYRYRGES